MKKERIIKDEYELKIFVCYIYKIKQQLHSVNWNNGLSFVEENTLQTPLVVKYSYKYIYKKIRKTKRKNKLRKKEGKIIRL